MVILINLMQKFMCAQNSHMQLQRQQGKSIYVHIEQVHACSYRDNHRKKYLCAHRIGTCMQLQRQQGNVFRCTQNRYMHVAIETIGKNIYVHIEQVHARMHVAIETIGKKVFRCTQNRYMQLQRQLQGKSIYVHIEQVHYLFQSSPSNPLTLHHRW